jgi:hypothetical protein
MRIRAAFLSIVICGLALFTTQSFAQGIQSPPVRAIFRLQQQSPTPNGNSIEAVTNELGLIQKSLQTLNTRLREIGEKLGGPDSKQGDAGTQNRITINLELLTRAEDRAGVLRKQLLELIEKETSYKSRLAQIDEDMRPENIERAMSGIGTTRTAELRDVRRRSLEIEKRGLESLLGLTSQSRLRLEEDVRQADSLVQRLRQRLLPLIDKEIEKINPN